ncbi:hypothetical protein [Helicobacter sp. T3_23-1056]
MKKLIILCLLCFAPSNAFIETLPSQEEIESKPLLYSPNTTQINGETLFFNDLRQNPTLPKGLKPLVLTKSTKDFTNSQKQGANTYHRFEGDLEVRGVLQYAMSADYSGFYQEWILFFDEPYYMQNLIPKNKPYPSKTDIFPYSAYMSIKNHQLPKELYDLASKNPLSIIGVRVSARLKTLDITTGDGDEWRFFGEIQNLQPIGKTFVKYPNRLELYVLGANGEAILAYASKDSYVNLRESPNGKILYAIQKNDMPSNVCEYAKYKTNKGVIIFLGKDSANPKWYKIAYIPPNAKDTSKAIYGVIHNSQVGFECGE